MNRTTSLRVARATDHLDAVVRFYVEGLGFEQLGSFADHEGFDGVMIGVPGADYHLEFTYQPGHSVGGAPTQENLLVFYLPDRQDWEAAVARMETAGYAPVVSLNPYWDRHGRTFEDPDGYRVVLQKCSLALESTAKTIHFAVISLRSKSLRDQCRDDRICAHQPMGNRVHTSQGVTRVFLATMLLLGLLGGVLPLETMASGPTCALACCAARAPHAAGSCLNHSCHAVRTTREQLRARVTESLCGSTLVARQLSRKRTYPITFFAESQPSTPAQLYSSTVSKTCSSDYGSCAGYENTVRQRNVALTAHAQQPEPLGAIQQLDARLALNEKRNALCRQCAPRAPPLSLS